MNLKTLSIIGFLFNFEAAQAGEEIHSLKVQEKIDSFNKSYESAIPDKNLEMSSIDDTACYDFKKYENIEFTSDTDLSKSLSNDEVQIDMTTKSDSDSKDSTDYSEVDSDEETATQMVHICIEEMKKGYFDVKNIGDSVDIIRSKPELKQLMDIFARIYEQDNVKNQLSKLKKENYAKIFIDRWQVSSLLICSLSKGLSAFYPEESYLGYVVGGLYIARFGVCLIDELIMKYLNNKRKDILNTYSADTINRSDTLIYTNDIDDLLKEAVFDAENISNTVDTNLLDEKQKQKFHNLRELIHTYSGNENILQKLYSAGGALTKWLGACFSLVAGIGAGVAIVWNDEDSIALECTNLASSCIDVLTNTKVSLSRENERRERKMLDLCEMAYLCNEAFYYPQK